MAEIFQLNQFRKQIPKPISQPQTQYNLNPDTNLELYLKGDEFIFSKSKSQDLFEIFMFQCDPKLRQWEHSHNGLRDLKQIQEVFPKDLENTIKKLQNSKLDFQENPNNKIYDQEIRVQQDQITNHLITQYELNISQITSLGYTRFFELFCDRYNNTNELDSDFQLFTKEQIRYLAVKDNNQNVLKTLAEFPQINQDNLEYFLQFWDDIMFNEDITIY
jgi:hypothetical protein